MGTFAFVATKFLPLSMAMIALGYFVYKEWAKEKYCEEGSGFSWDWMPGDSYRHKKDDDAQRPPEGKESRGRGATYGRMKEEGKGEEVIREKECPMCDAEFDERRRFPIVFYPCYHTVCLTCSVRILRSCPTCNSLIKDRSLLYN